MYYLNKLVWFFLNPMMLTLSGSLVGIALGLLAKRTKLRRTGYVLAIGSPLLLWAASTLSAVCLLGLPLERDYLGCQTVESSPSADAIVLLGGGIGKCEELAYPDIFDAGDRVIHAARLYRAGKAPLVVVSGTNDLASTVPLLTDLGVPREAIVVDNVSRNTYENSRFTEKLLKERGVLDGKNPRPGAHVLVVTSAWHMTRALGNFAKTSLKVAPASCDFAAHGAFYGRNSPLDWVMPSVDGLNLVNRFAKEWLGRLARK